jgi:hypothetical protein
MHSALVSQSRLSYNRYSLYRLHTDNIENIFHSDFCCCNAINWRLFTGRCIEMAKLLLLPCVYLVTRCLPVSYLATLWPATLQYCVTSLHPFLHKTCRSPYSFSKNHSVKRSNVSCPLLGVLLNIAFHISGESWFRFIGRWRLKFQHTGRQQDGHVIRILEE